MHPLLRPTAEGSFAMGFVAVLGFYISSIFVVAVLAPFVGGAVAGRRADADGARWISAGLAVGSVGAGLLFAGAVGTLALEGWTVHEFTAYIWTIFLLVWASLLIGIAGFGGWIGAALRTPDSPGESLDFGQYEPPGDRIEPQQTPASETSTDASGSQSDGLPVGRNAPDSPAASSGVRPSRAILEGTAVAIGGLVLAAVAVRSGLGSRLIYGRFVLLPAACFAGGFVGGYRSPSERSTALYSGLWVGLLTGIGTIVWTGGPIGFFFLFLGLFFVLALGLAAVGGLLGGWIASQKRAESGQ